MIHRPPRVRALRLALALALLIVPAAPAPVASARQADCDPQDPTAPCPLADGAHVQSVITSRGGRNYFWFGVPFPGMHLHVQMSDLPDDYDLYLFSDQSSDPSQPYAQSVTPDLAPEVIDRDSPDVGTYVLEVVSDPGQNFDPENPYTLDFALQAPPAPEPPPAAAPAAPASPEAARATVPPILYRSTAVASAQVRAAGLVPRVQAVNQYSPAGAGTVAAQNPPAGTVVDVGSGVDVLVASGSVPIPNLIGAPEQDALNQLHALGFNVDLRRVRSTAAAAGQVADVRPGFGVSLPIGSTVILLISQG